MRTNARPEDIVVQDHGSTAVFGVDDRDALARAARLLLISNSDDALAVRFALLGLDAGRADSVWNAGGRTLVRRGGGEADAAWRERVLRAWGVDDAVAKAESERFSEWMKAAKLQGSASQGR